MRELHPDPGGATEGFEFKWVQDEQTYRLRVHSVDAGAPPGSNAANGWDVRIQSIYRLKIHINRSCNEESM